MVVEVGQVEAIFRYPVKSIGGDRLEVANLGWHGLDGDRQLAFRRVNELSGMPWLTASKLPDLLRFAPHRRKDGAPGELPTMFARRMSRDGCVRGGAGHGGRPPFGAPVQMMQLRHGSSMKRASP